jgi:hypothetical protein
MGVVLGGVAGLVVCTVVLALVLLLGGRSTDARPTAQALCVDLQSQDYSSLYNALSPQLQALGTQAQFTASQQQLDALQGNVTGCSYDIQRSDSTQATVTITVSRARAASAAGSVHLVYVDGAWKVDAYDAGVI